MDAREDLNVTEIAQVISLRIAQRQADPKDRIHDAWVALMYFLLRESPAQLSKVPDVAVNYQIAFNLPLFPGPC